MFLQTKDSWQERALRCIEQHPLLKTNASIAGLRWLDARERVEAVVVGIGLCSPHHVSQGVPVDMLGMLLPAEALRCAVGASKLHVLIADTHAIANGFAPERVEAQARRVETALAGLIANSPLERIDYVRASSYHDAGSYRATLAHVRELGEPRHEYVDRQLADILFLRQQLGPLIKVGWLLDDSLEQPRWRDEGAFDSKLLDYFEDEIGFVYTRPGRSLCDRKPRVPPYVALEPSRRICLSANEQPGQKLRRAGDRGVAEQTIQGCRRMLRQIVYSYCRQVRQLPRGTLEYRVRSLIDDVAAEPAQPLVAAS